MTEDNKDGIDKLIDLGAKNVSIRNDEFDGEVLSFGLLGNTFNISAQYGQSCAFIELKINDAKAFMDGK